MRFTLISACAAMLILAGCSKHAAPTPTMAEPEAPPAAAPVKDDSLMAAGIEDLNRKVAQQQYEAAVGALVSMSQLPKSPEQEAQFRARLRETETALLQRAAQGDVAARQSAQALGQMMTGR